MLRGHRFFDYGGGGVFWQGVVAGFIGFWGGLLEAQRAMRKCASPSILVGTDLYLGDDLGVIGWAY